MQSVPWRWFILPDLLYSLCPPTDLLFLFVAGWGQGVKWMSLMPRQKMSSARTMLSAVPKDRVITQFPQVRLLAQEYLQWIDHTLNLRWINHVHEYHSVFLTLLCLRVCMHTCIYVHIYIHTPMCLCACDCVSVFTLNEPSCRVAQQQCTFSFPQPYHLDASPYKNIQFHPKVKAACAENRTGRVGWVKHNTIEWRNTFPRSFVFILLC